jgi:hypothetical protein
MDTNQLKRWKPCFLNSNFGFENYSGVDLIPKDEREYIEMLETYSLSKWLING